MTTNVATSQVGPHPNDGGLSRHHVMARAEASLKNLGIASPEMTVMQA